MKKKHKSTETTGPIRVVLFKGTQKPTTKQITEKHMVALYGIIGFLLFSILFLLTTLLIVLKDNAAISEKYTFASNEVTRLRKIIRNMSRYNGITGEDSQSEETEKPKKDNESLSAIFSKENPDSTMDKTNQNTSEESTSEIDESALTELTSREKSSSPLASPGGSGEDSSSQAAKMRAEITGFRANYNEGGRLFRVRYWISNLNEGNVMLEGKAVVIAKVGDKVYTYPSLPIENGEAVVGKGGILFKIQMRKEMVVQMKFAAKPTDIKEAIIILNDLNGNEITRSSYEISKP